MKTIIVLLAAIALLIPATAALAEENGAEGEFQFIFPDSVFVWNAPREDGSQIARFEGFLADTALVRIVVHGLRWGFMYGTVSPLSVTERVILNHLNGKRVLVYANLIEIGGRRFITDIVVFSLPEHRAVGYPRYCKEASRKDPYSDKKWEELKKRLKYEPE